MKCNCSPFFGRDKGIFSFPAIRDLGMGWKVTGHAYSAVLLQSSILFFKTLIMLIKIIFFQSQEGKIYDNI